MTGISHEEPYLSIKTKHDVQQVKRYLGKENLRGTLSKTKRNILILIHRTIKVKYTLYSEPKSNSKNS